MELLSRVCVASSAAAGLPFLAAVCHAAELSQIPFHTAGRFTAALWESCNSRRCFTPTRVSRRSFSNGWGPHDKVIPNANSRTCQVATHFGKGTDRFRETQHPYCSHSCREANQRPSKQELSSPLRLQLCKINCSAYGLQLPFSKTLYA